MPTGEKPRGVSLAALLTQPQARTTGTTQTPAITKYTTFRFRQKGGHIADYQQRLADCKAISEDTAFRLYIADLGDRRNNNGLVSPEITAFTRQAVSAFLHYASLPVNNHTLNDLVTYKRNNPASTDIELALKSYSLDAGLSRRRLSNQASRIQGIFRANFAPLNVRINTHFPLAEENCSLGIFREIFSRLDPQQQDCIQWGLYVPERARAAYRVPFEDIDLSRSDFAIVKIRGSLPNSNGVRSKMRVDHICLPPIDFAKHVITSAKAANNNCPFPSHESIWTQITTFAKREFGVKLRSNYTRKYFEAMAEDIRFAAC